MSLYIPALVAVTLAFIVYFLGAFLTRKVAFLRVYHIPEPVSGGIVVALGTWVIFLLFDRKIEFDLAARDYLLVVLFSTIGLNARVADLLRGGRLLLTLLGLTLGFMVFQNMVGLLGVTLFDMPRPVSVLMGSASLIGGARHRNCMGSAHTKRDRIRGSERAWDRDGHAWFNLRRTYWGPNCERFD